MSSTSQSTSQIDTTLPLLHSTKRLLALPQLPPYATDLVAPLVREVRSRDALVASILARHAASSPSSSTGATPAFDPSRDPATACALLVQHLSIRRAKRALLTYHRARAHKIEEAVWAGREEPLLAAGAAGAAAEGETAGAGEGSLAPEEEEYLRRFAELLAQVKGRWTDVDLTGSLEPPGDLFVDVRCVRDAGVVETEYGSINLTKNSQYFVRQGDVERLIAGGYLVRLD